MSTPTDRLEPQLVTLKLPFLRAHYQELARHAIAKSLGHIDYLAMLIDGETQQRNERSTQRRIRAARFPYLKTLHQFDFTHPKNVDSMKVKNLFRLGFIADKANVLFIGGCGLGKTHLAIALGHQACVAGHTVLFTTAMEMLNRLAAAQAAHRLDHELGKYLKPQVLIIDELGYLPIDRYGADLLFQIIGARYEAGSIVLTSNRIFKDWPVIFDNDATLTSVVLDRLVHHHDLIILEGASYRMRSRRKE